MALKRPGAAPPEPTRASGCSRTRADAAEGFLSLLHAVQTSAKQEQGARPRRCPLIT